MKLDFTALIFWACLAVCYARIKEPGWKHCVIPLHALPGEWGRVTSPGFPNGINKQIQCSWMITSNPGFRIKLAFQTLNMTGSMKSCFTQFVEILDYKIGSSVGKFCGARRPGDYVSYGSKLRFDLQGDTSGQKTKGFEIRFRATKEIGGFKSTWAFPSAGSKKSKGNKGNSKKKKKKPGPPKNPKALGPPLSSKPAGSRPGGNRGGPPRRPAPSEESVDQPTEEPVKQAKPAKPATKAPPPRTPPGQLPPRRVNQPPKRILPQVLPPSGVNRPVYYGANNNVRGIDHGSSRVISSSDDEPEQEYDLYLIIGIAAGGVVALILIFIMMKICICDKNKKEKKLREEKAKAAMNAQSPDHFNMSPLPGSVPEQFMSEQIVPPLQSYPYLHPAHVSSVSHHHHHNPQTGTIQPIMMPHRGSTRSRARSTKSRSTRSHSDIRRSSKHRSKSRSSLHGSRSRASVRKAKSKSLQNLPHAEGQWVMIDQRHMTVPRGMKAYVPQSVTESSESSSTEWETESSESESDFTEIDYRRHKKHNTVPAHPPPYSFISDKPYYVRDKRDYDEGYDTGRRAQGIKSHSKKREEKRNKRKESEKVEKKRKRERRRRKHSY